MKERKKERGEWTRAERNELLTKIFSISIDYKFWIGESEKEKSVGNEFAAELHATNMD